MITKEKIKILKISAEIDKFIWLIDPNDFNKFDKIKDNILNLLQKVKK